MKEIILLLKRTKLFSGIGDEDIVSMLNCLGAKTVHFKKGAYVFRQGAYLHTITLLTKGRLHIQKEDYWGNLSILNEITPGELFGEAYIAPDSGAMLNDVVAVEDSEAVAFDAEKVLSVCSFACPFHTQLTKNLFYMVSGKNRNLVRKLGTLSQRSTREKLLSYLSDEAKRQGASSFSIPFNRQQLADFLSVDRSAMSNELCKMRDAGLLSFQKNQFTLLENNSVK